MMVLESTSLRQGRALHRLLEIMGRRFLMGHSLFKPSLDRPLWALALASYALKPDDAQAVIESAWSMVHAPRSKELLGLDQPPAIYEQAGHALAIEREWSDASAAVIRPDWVCIGPQAIRIIDFKWRCLSSELSDYAAQLSRYQQALQDKAAGHAISSWILTADGEVWMLEEGRLVHCQVAGRPAS